MAAYRLIWEFNKALAKLRPKYVEEVANMIIVTTSKPTLARDLIPWKLLSRQSSLRELPKQEFVPEEVCGERNENDK